MQMRALGIPFVVALAASVLVGCPSNDGKSPGVQASASSGGSGAPPSNGTGPLANLEAQPFMNEVWIANEGGTQLPFLYWGAQNVRLSAQCRQASGQLVCDAIRQMRSGAPVEIPRRSLTGNMSAGTRVCTKLGNKLVSAHNAAGAEDGFCRFADGSMITTGALEQYAMRVTE